MKNRLIYLICVSIALLFCAESFSAPKTKASKAFVIEGTVAPETPDVAYLVYISNENFQFYSRPSDTIRVVNKKFSYRNTSIDEVRLLNLRAKYPDGSLAQSYINLVLVPGELAKVSVFNGYFELDGSKFFHEMGSLDDVFSRNENEAQLVKGKLSILQQSGLTETDDFYETYIRYLELNIEAIKLQWKYLPDHGAEEGTVMAFLFSGRASANTVKEKAAPEVVNGRLKKYIDYKANKETRERLAQTAQQTRLEKNLKETQPGMMFKDFEVVYDGKKQKFSDYVGKGKYVLVDFWASWCGPCRQETPNLKAVYEKYKGNKFEVLGVACWDEPADTKKAVEEEGITYPQIFNAQQIATDLYGINGIPQIILFAPDGKIVARNLRGANIESAVSAALGK